MKLWLRAAVFLESYTSIKHENRDGQEPPYITTSSFSLTVRIGVKVYSRGGYEEKVYLASPPTGKALVVSSQLRPSNAVLARTLDVVSTVNQIQLLGSMASNPSIYTSCKVVKRIAE